MKTKDEKEEKPIDFNMEVERHTKAALHHEEAAVKHRAAAAQYAANDPEKAAEIAQQAHKHEILMPVYDPTDRDQHAAM